MQPHPVPYMTMHCQLHSFGLQTDDMVTQGSSLNWLSATLPECEKPFP